MSVARVLAASMISACILGSGASAQTYPDRPITMMVAFPPGGADDAIARTIQDPMQKALGQPIVIENIGGAGGMIAASKAARAEPDGYTILLHQVGLAAGMTLYPNRTFDAEKDFVTIGLINTDMLLAPAGTPRPIVDKLNSALHAALANPKAQKTFAEGGMDPFRAAEETPEAASALLKREIRLWGDVIRANHIAAQ
jgi:tripartite-type tricarboxylate transporter receptor subunit TctC